MWLFQAPRRRASGVLKLRPQTRPSLHDPAGHQGGNPRRTLNSMAQARTARARQPRSKAATGGIRPSQLLPTRVITGPPDDHPCRGKPRKPTPATMGRPSPSRQQRTTHSPQARASAPPHASKLVERSSAKTSERLHVLVTALQEWPQQDSRTTFHNSCNITRRQSLLRTHTCKSRKSHCRPQPSPSASCPPPNQHCCHQHQGQRRHARPATSSSRGGGPTHKRQPCFLHKIRGTADPGRPVLKPFGQAYPSGPPHPCPLGRRLRLGHRHQQTQHSPFLRARQISSHHTS